MNINFNKYKFIWLMVLGFGKHKSIVLASGKGIMVHYSMVERGQE